MFGKVFESMFTGSMVGSGPTVFAVWVYAIVNAKPPGEVEINPRLLAVQLGCDESDIDSALGFLQRPDPESRTATEDGRKLIREGQFLYRLPTWDHYQRVRDHEARKAKWREDKRRQRADMSSSSPTNTQTETETGRRGASRPSANGDA